MQIRGDLAIKGIDLPWNSRKFSPDRWASQIGEGLLDFVT